MGTRLEQLSRCIFCGTVALLLSAEAFGFYFTGGPIDDKEGNSTRDAISSAAAALQKIMAEEKQVVDQAKTEEEKKMMESFGKEVYLDMNAPLEVDTVRSREQLDKDIDAALKASNGNSELARLVRTQVEQERRIVLFNLRLKTLVDETKGPVNLTQQLKIWSDLKAMQSEMVLAGLAELQQANALKAELLMKRTQLIQRKRDRERLEKLYGN